jgi:hypothetical protein
VASLAEALFNSTSNTINQSKGGLGGLNEGFQAGIQLAQKKEQLQQQREQMEQQKGLVEAKKIAMLATKSGEIGSLPPKIRKSAIKNFLVPMGDQLGYPLGETFLTALGSDDVLDQTKTGAIASQFINAVEAQDMETIASLSGPMTQILGGDPSALAKFTMDATKTANTVRAQQATLQATQGNRQRQQENIEITKQIQATQRFTNFTKDMSKEVKSRFSAHDDKKESTRLANTELKSVMKDIRKGRKPSEISFNAASRGIAKVFNKGAMTEQDVGDFRQLSGIENLTGDKIRKWVTGGINANAAKQLLSLTERIATRLDNEGQALADSLSPQFDNAEFPGMSAIIREKSGLDAKLRSTLGGPEAPPKQVRTTDPETGARMIGQEEADRIVEKIKSAPDSLGEDILAELQRIFPGATEEQINALIKKARK